MTNLHVTPLDAFPTLQVLKFIFVQFNTSQTNDELSWWFLPLLVLMLLLFFTRKLTQKTACSINVSFYHHDLEFRANQCVSLFSSPHFYT